MRVKPRIALINMPFASANYPSIQMGILKSVLKREGYPVENYYFNLEFLKNTNLEAYELLANECLPMAGEHIFSEPAFGLKAEMGLKSFETWKEDKSFVKEEYENEFNKMKNVAAKWLNELAESNDWGKYEVLGFTCSYSQVLSSVAFAKRVKERFPKLKIIFGGTSMDGPAGKEMSQKLPYVDCIVQGEGENAILDLLSMIEKEKEIPSVYRSKKKTDLDAIPLPDYDEYYEYVRKNGYLNEHSKFGMGHLLYETSRGCWWGAKKQCTFCGVNQTSMEYREKSTKRILGDLAELSKKYHSYNFFMTDSILNENLFKELFPTLVEKETSYKFFYEVKSSMKYENLKILKKAGCSWLQPGIESLNTEILKLMSKGVNASRNIEFLKGCRTLDIFARWNIIYGFPGEKEEQYEAMISLIPKIVHIQPPKDVVQVQLARFSKLYEKYVEGSKKENDIPYRNIKCAEQYEYCYPKDWNHKDMAFFLTSDCDTGVKKTTYLRLFKTVEDWKKLWEENEEKPRLKFKKGIGYAHVLDTRRGERTVHEIDGDYFKVALTLEDKSKSINQISKDTGLQKQRIEQVCGEFVENDLVLLMDGKYLWLPISEKELSNIKCFN